MTEPIDIAARRKLLEAAQKRLYPWELSDAIGHDAPECQALIVAAVNDYGALLDEVERLRELRDAVQSWADWYKRRVRLSDDPPGEWTPAEDELLTALDGVKP